MPSSDQIVAGVAVCSFRNVAEMASRLIDGRGQANMIQITCSMTAMGQGSEHHAPLTGQPPVRRTRRTLSSVVAPQWSHAVSCPCPSLKSAKIVHNLRTKNSSSLLFESDVVLTVVGRPVTADYVLNANAPAFQCGGNDRPPSIPISKIRASQLFLAAKSGQNKSAPILQNS